jgi:hypothetical protein
MVVASDGTVVARATTIIPIENLVAFTAQLASAGG